MSENWPVTPFGHLQPGVAYLVVRAFRDFDGREHPVGEGWTFIGSSFLPYDDGLSLFVKIGGHDRQIRLQWRDEEQAPIADHLHDYVEAKK
jgi:hypothetical protein